MYGQMHLSHWQMNFYVELIHLRSTQVSFYSLNNNKTFIKFDSQKVNSVYRSIDDCEFKFSQN